MTKTLTAVTALALIAAACGSGVDSDAGTPEGAVLPVAGQGDAVGGNGPDLTPPTVVPENVPATLPDAGDEPDPVPVTHADLEFADDQPTVIDQVVIDVDPPGDKEPAAPSPAASAPAVQAAADLAARLGVDESAITVVTSEAVTWRDGSLGCPQPGMEYPQALVEGMKIVLAHGGATFEYHSGGNGVPFLCRTAK